jgi:IS30 family transposase
MLAFLLPSKTQKLFLIILNRLEEAISTKGFQKPFPVFMTDNGPEFTNPILLETGLKFFTRTRIFYCDPNASYQKGALEKNHEFIR